jgi:hypothetical protein
VDRAVAVVVYNFKYLFTFYDVCVYNEEKKIRARRTCIARKMKIQAFLSVLGEGTVCLICSKAIPDAKDLICSAITKVYVKINLVFLKGS